MICQRRTPHDDICFAKERTVEGIREALDNRRTAAYYRELVIGREEILRPFFEKCIEIKEVKRTDKEVTLSVTNSTDLVLKLKRLRMILLWFTSAK